MILAINWLQIVMIVLGVIIVLLIILYFIGSKLQARQVAADKTMKQMSMVVSLLILDKAKLNIKDSGLMKQV